MRPEAALDQGIVRVVQKITPLAAEAHPVPRLRDLVGFCHHSVPGADDLDDQIANTGRLKPECVEG